MILYNTLMGVAAGLALILVPVLARKLLRRETVAPEGWALTFGVLGAILTFLGGAMAVTWPLTANPPINIMFSEPNIVLGLLLLGAAIFLWQRKAVVQDVSERGVAYLRSVLTPVSWLLFGLGLVLFACMMAILRFGFVGGAPEAEPITGLLHDKPWIENTFFGVIYGMPAIALLLTPFALRTMNKKMLATVGWLLAIAGGLFLVFSAMNYYTHIGLLVNLLKGTNFEF